MAHGIGLIGLGIMGQRMLQGLSLNPRVQPVAAWDPSPAAMEKVRQTHKELLLADSADALVRHPGVACVYIASPPASHLKHAAHAFDRGKTVFSEKPLGVDPKESAAIVERVERDRLKAAINFPFASAPAVLELEKRIRAGAIGRIQRIEIKTDFVEWPRGWQQGARWLTLRAEGGFVREVVSHFLFLTRRLIGPLSVEASDPAYPEDGKGAETAIAARLTAGALPVTLSGGIRGTAADANSWTAHGEKGALKLHDWINLARSAGSGWEPVDLGPGELRPRSVKAQLDGLADLIEGKASRLASFREGFEVQKAIEELLGNRKRRAA